MADQDEPLDGPEPATTSRNTGSVGTSDSSREGDTHRTLPEPAGTAPDGDGTFPTVPGYELTAQVGEGGMAVVYRAKQTNLNRDVAIKLLKAAYAPYRHLVQRFREESQITGQLQHPTIPPVHDVGTLSDGRPYLVMKFVKGRTLEALLKERPDVAHNRARFVAIFERIAVGVAYAHDRKVLHRDLKPSNVMVGAFDEVQVMDWGVAKVLTGPAREPSEPGLTEIGSTREPDSATRAGSVWGTLAYMGPEQADGEVEKIDSRSDVFGLGAVLCAILTGKPPYLGASREDIWLKASRGDTAEALARLDACGADPELVALCKRCLALERDDRPCDAGAVAGAVSAHLAAAEDRARQAELDRVLAVAAAERAERESARAAAERAEERRKRRLTQYLLVGAGLCVLVLVSAGAGLLSLWRDAEGARSLLAGEKKQSERARDEAVRQKEEADKAHREKQTVAYRHGVSVAHARWRDNKLAEARSSLEELRPDLRGWEWHYLQRLCNGSLLTLEHDGATCAAFSPDGVHVVTGGSDGVVRVWDARTGRPGPVLDNRAGAIGSVAFGSTGPHFVTARADGRARVWDVRTGDPFRDPLGLSAERHRGAVYAAVFSPDGALIATGGADGTVQVFDAKTRERKHLLATDAGAVLALAFSADGARLAVGCRDNRAQVWDAECGFRERELPHDRAVRSVAFGTGDAHVLTTVEGKARVWDTKTGAEVGAFQLLGHEDPVRVAAYSADGSQIVTGGEDKTARVWDAKTGTALAVLRGHTGAVLSAAFSADGAHVVTVGEDNTARVWRARPDVGVRAFGGHTGAIKCAAFSADGSQIVTASEDETARVWDAKTGASRRSVEHEGAVTSAAFSPDGAFAATGSSDGAVRVWDAKTWAVSRVLTGHAGKVHSVAFSADGAWVVTAGSDRTARGWNAKTGAPGFELRHIGDVLCAAFSADGAHVVTGSRDGIARVWDGKTGRGLLVLVGHTGHVHSVAFSPDGSRVVTAGGERDGTARVWDAKTGAQQSVLKHTGAVFSAAFSPDGARIVTGSSDKSVRVWDVNTGAELLVLTEPTGTVFSVSFSRDGSRIVAGGADKFVRVWDATPLARAVGPK